MFNVQNYKIINGGLNTAGRKLHECTFGGVKVISCTYGRESLSQYCYICTCEEGQALMAKHKQELHGEQFDEISVNILTLLFSSCSRVHGRRSETLFTGHLLFNNSRKTGILGYS